MKAVATVLAAFAVVSSLALAPTGISLDLKHKPKSKFTVAPDESGALKRTWKRTAFRKGQSPLVDFEEGSGAVPLGGNIWGVGEFYVTFYSPLADGSAQSFEVQVDTGSSDLGVIGQSCSDCGTPKSKFNPANSSPVNCNDASLQCGSCTSSNQCEYSLSYLDGSGYTANVYKAPIYFEAGSSLRGGATKLSGDAYLGAIVKESSGFESPPVEGIMGFAFPAVSEIGATTAFQSLVDAGSVADIFAISVTGNKGGSLFLGGTGLPDGTPIQYTPLLGQNWYTVYVADMLLDGKSLGVDPNVYNSGGAIVDSGTTQFLIPQKAYKSLAAIAKSLCKTTRLVGVCGEESGKTIFDQYCFEMSESDRMAYPTITVKIGQGGEQLSLDLGPQYYLTPYSETNQNLWCMGAVGVPESDGTILGDVFMQGFNVVFDRANSRVGFHAVN